jgi:hydrogenase nickel incorporation protein HypB
MCESCGAGDSRVMPFEVHERILAANDRVARYNREQFRDHNVVAVNLMGGPGSGKTAILEATARAMGTSARIGALTADPATESDALRLRAIGIAAASIATGSACHLDAEMVHKGLHQIPWRTLDLLFIENVGNLVCPALFDLGQDANVVALSVTDGEEQPLKYPTIFHKADLVLLTKSDLGPQLSDVSLEILQQNLVAVMPRPAMLVVSAKSGAGIDPWLRWLEGIGRPRTAACAGSGGAGRAV